MCKSWWNNVWIPVTVWNFERIYDFQVKNNENWCVESETDTCTEIDSQCEFDDPIFVFLGYSKQFTNYQYTNDTGNCPMV